MKQLSVIITRKYRPLSIAAILDVFQTVNNYYVESGGQPFFQVNLVTAGDPAETPMFHEDLAVFPLSEAPRADLILIPAFRSGALPAALQENAAFLPWLQQQHLSGAEVAAFCSGVLLLAATGLLNGKKATTHLAVANELIAAFPQVDVHPHAVVTDDGGIYTSGGATSTFHLLLHILEKYCHRDIAIKMAKVFAIDMDRDQQSYFADWQPKRACHDELVSEAQQRMESRFKEGITVEEVIRDLPVSRRNFIRRFKLATGITPIEYLQRIRIEAAKKLLEQRQENITGVMMHAGYEDAKAFRQVFRKIVGLSPREYREKYAG
ncbi:GlxA family transcriptional regulator [Chitinophaga sp. XS-30]|uniref:GlxA family transcriptional regulator n=1 Tax=Chitinophaga sp. XS-30 TaxID=2604421 RepID=UPI0011DCBA81|nr:helix-turn-helix domain-containing protein [Chitinophaga sp. XS-30]QEH41579.1 helix-turn-helix domain-containing protein [Chitinophaga sp. XS-30]